MKTKKKPTRLTKELLEMARGMRKSGVMPQAAYEKITMRHLSTESVATPTITADDVRAMREKANMSQAVFAHHLNLTVGYISQLERGEKRPTGATLKLLQVVKCNGVGALVVNDAQATKAKRGPKARGKAA